MEREHATSCLDKFKSAFVEQKLKKTLLTLQDFSIRTNSIKFSDRITSISVGKSVNDILFEPRRNSSAKHKSFLERARNALSMRTQCAAVSAVSACSARARDNAPPFLTPTKQNFFRTFSVVTDSINQPESVFCVDILMTLEGTRKA